MMMGMTSRVRGRDEVEEGSAASNVLVVGLNSVYKRKRKIKQ